MSKLISDMIFEDEFRRNEQAIKDFEQEVRLLPKGSIQKKESKNKEYHFLVYRENKKVKSKHIPISEDIEKLQKKINQRISLEKEIKLRKAENKEYARKIKQELKRRNKRGE